MLNKKPTSAIQNGNLNLQNYYFCHLSISLCSKLQYVRFFKWPHLISLCSAGLQLRDNFQDRVPTSFYSQLQWLYITLTDAVLHRKTEYFSSFLVQLSLFLKCKDFKRSWSCLFSWWKEFSGGIYMFMFGKKLQKK